MGQREVLTVHAFFRPVMDIPILEKESWQNKLQQETNLIGEILVGLAYIFLSLFPRFFAE